MKLTFKKIYLNPDNDYQEINPSQTLNVFLDEKGNMYLRNGNFITGLINSFKEESIGERPVWSKKLKELGVDLTDLSEINLTSIPTKIYSLRTDAGWKKIDPLHILRDRRGKSYIIDEGIVKYVFVKDEDIYYLGDKELGSKYFVNRLFGLPQE